ncbi:hypothetical protein HanXRQr2_Chr03g0096921 [Helianthus annuus]|uniref:Uncharacterized protein n=1 Tax=Helianthus annuus TaxID=4232 RepID=A0A9K3NUN4_HELAN|nr:hypothetical protein HanXRQr2_Chr03g0096921 [Helianthus annuus]KAJ0942563.1 hypothetical protein HanPSC8_Chr03g0093441 [Helianthus annuus]
MIPACHIKEGLTCKVGLTYKLDIPRTLDGMIKYYILTKSLSCFLIKTLMFNARNYIENKAFKEPVESKVSPQSYPPLIKPNDENG